MDVFLAISIINGQPVFGKPIPEILSKVKIGGGIKILEPDEYITECQRAWWKGILLPALAKDTGDSEEYWETKLKLQVMPDEFAPFMIAYGKQVFPCVPSITKLSMRKMSMLIKKSVQHLREDPEYDGRFQWVVEPIKELKK